MPEQSPVGAKSSDWTGTSKLVYQTLRVLFTLMAWTRLIRPTVRGADFIPDAGAVLLMSNHRSNIDPVFISWAMKRPAHIPGKRELWAVPGLRFMLRKVGAFPVDREIADSSALRRSLEILRGGEILAVFPEGRRSRDESLGPFQPALTKLALRLDIPVIPVAVSGTDDWLPAGKPVPRLGSKVSVSFGPPIDLREFRGRKLSQQELEAATEIIRSAVATLLKPQTS